jgi:hypothetical protein
MLKYFDVHWISPRFFTVAWRGVKDTQTTFHKTLTPPVVPQGGEAQTTAAPDSWWTKAFW